MHTLDTTRPSHTLTSHTLHPPDGPTVLIGLDFEAGDGDTLVEFIRLDQIARYRYDPGGPNDVAVLTIWFVGADTPMRIQSGVTDRLSVEDPLSELDDELFNALVAQGTCACCGSEAATTQSPPPAVAGSGVSPSLRAE